MTKEEAYKKLCVVLYNSIKEKLKAVNELNIDSFHLPFNIVCDPHADGITIYDCDGDPFEKAPVLTVTNDGKINVINTTMPNNMLLNTSVIALLLLTEMFAQGHQYTLDWDRGGTKFGEYSPVIVFNVDEVFSDGWYTYYSQMADFLTAGMMATDNESEK